MPGFTELVHGLPAERFNQIKAIVFTPDKGEILIRSDYQPSKLLQISSATREQYAAFYGPGTISQFEDFRTLRRYLRSLTESHRDMIDRIQLMVKVPDGVGDPTTTSRGGHVSHHQSTHLR